MHFLNIHGVILKHGKCCDRWLRYDGALFSSSLCTKNHTDAHAQIYNCVHTLTNTKPGMGSYCLLQYVCGLWTKSTSEVQNSLGTEYKCLTTGRQQYTPAHRHNTGGFGTPMLVLLLSIFQHRRRAGYRTGQTHSCLRLPPLWRGGGGYRLSDRHNDQPSHSISTELSVFGVPASHPISSSRLSS